MFNLSENELQEKIIRLIKNNSFLNKISGKEKILSQIDEDLNPNFTPGYQIDFQLTSQYSRRALSVLKTLELADLISGESIKNISLQKDTPKKKERLYPDILLGNKEENSFILAELKKDIQTEREAITELLAYAIELKNHLPHIADSDIHLIIISTKFNTLLDHAIASLILGTKFKVLALKAKMNTDKLYFEIHMPDSWTDIWQNCLPPYAFSSITLVPYVRGEKDEELPERDTLPEIIDDLIMFEGAQNNSHGFFILWKNVSNGHADFCISIYQINPFVFLQTSLENNFVLNSKEPLSQYILSQSVDPFSYSHPESLFQIAKSLKQILNKYYDTCIEDCSSWTDHIELGSNFRNQAIPWVFNAWGNIGKYLRYLYFHPSITKSLFPKKQLNSYYYYKNPSFGIEVINRISGNTLFADGTFDLKSLYKYSVQLQEYAQISNNCFYLFQDDKDEEPLIPRLYYAALDLLSSQKEISYRVNYSLEDFGEPVILVIKTSNITEDPSKNMQDYITWFINYFLKGNNFYQSSFHSFFRWNLLFIEDFEKGLTDDYKERLKTEIKTTVKSYLIEYLTDELKNNSEFPDKDIIRLINKVYFNKRNLTYNTESEIKNNISSINNDTIIDTFEEYFLSILDLTGLELFHTPKSYKDFSSLIKNVAKLKRQLVKRFDEGYKYGAIIVTQNGSISIGVLSDVQFLEPIRDPEKEVYLSLEIPISYVTKVLWKDVVSGDAFKIMNKK